MIADETTFKDNIKNLLKPIDPVDDDPNVEVENETRIRMDCSSNVVSGKELKRIQKDTLSKLCKYLAPTYGPMGSYTQIIKGSDQDSTFAKYSKDGLTVLNKILFNKPIEMSIKTEVEEIARYVETRVGDGTTSAVILSNFIFDMALTIERKYKLPPHMFKRKFEQVIDMVKEEILNFKRDLTLDDIYNICMISTNGNETISKDISDIYKKYDMNVDINVTISNTPETMLKEYDGITFDEGYSDPAYVNNPVTNTADIYNAKVYMFDDPADDPTMISFFEKILFDNVIHPANKGMPTVPTVIMCPRLSRDSIAMLNKLIEILYNYDSKKITLQKPQILVITNYLGFGEGVAYDIGRLCGCKSIKKFINPEIKKAQQESGDAPTLENIHNFAGGCEFISADASRTKFSNPAAMAENPEIYNNLIKFLENEIIVAEERKEDRLVIGRIKERLKRLKMDNVEYYIGGIAISDRDALKDLVIDAVKNCRSAKKNGVGFAANYEGLHASYNITNILKSGNKADEVLYDIARGLFQAYYYAAMILYGSVVQDQDYIHALIADSILQGAPYDINELVSSDTWHPSYSVLCSIETDIEILEGVKKIIGIMVSSNQCVLQSVSINTY